MLSDGPGFDLSMMSAVMHVELKRCGFPCFVDMFYRAGMGESRLMCAVFLLHDVNEKPVKNFRQYVLALWLAGVSAYSVDVISRQVTDYSDVNVAASNFNLAARITHR